MKALVLSVLLLTPFSAFAQDLIVSEPDFETTVFRAEVVEVHSTGERAIPATRTVAEFQDLSLRILEGAREGEVVRAENSNGTTLREGDVVYIHRVDGAEGDLWSVGEPDRRWVLFGLLMLFVLITIGVGWGAGVRSVLSLFGSLLIILFGLIPALLSGAPPVLTCTFFAVLMLVFSMLVTHGYKKSTWVALVSGIVALVFAALIAEGAVLFAKLSGFVSDEVVFLNFATRGTLDLTGLLLGSILIGVVGVLNDISVSQVHTIEEIHDANPTLSRLEVFMRAARVGREHLGAVVNTLPIAYAGSALPLLMMFSVSTAPLLYIVNREVFAAEIIRIFAGGIALAFSGAIATVIGALLLVSPKKGA